MQAVKALHIAVLTATISVVTACILTPTKSDLANADYGTPPQDYETPIKELMKDYFYNPSSVRYRLVIPPREDYQVLGQEITYGHTVCYAINATNLYGNELGESNYWFFFRYDGVLLLGDLDGSEGTRIRCNSTN